MNDHQFADTLALAIHTLDADQFEDLAEQVAKARTFKQDGVMTTNAGFTVTLNDGTKFQVTVVRSR